jgi:K+-transporting ATPase A subunit
MKNEKEILEENLEKMLLTALTPRPQEDKKAELYQRLIRIQQKESQVGEFPFPILVSVAFMLILLCLFLVMLFISSGLSSTLLPGFGLALLSGVVNLLMIPVAGYIIVKRRQNG